MKRRFLGGLGLALLLVAPSACAPRASCSRADLFVKEFAADFLEMMKDEEEPFGSDSGAYVSGPSAPAPSPPSAW